MRKLFLLGALAILLAPGVSRASDAFAVISGTTTSVGCMLPYGFTTTTPPYNTYTAGTMVHGPIIITKIYASVTSTASGGTAISMYDTTAGTYATATRLILPPMWLPLAPPSGNPTILDFTTQKSARTDEDGLYCKNFPVFVNTGNLAYVVIFYRPWTSPTQSGAAK